MSFKDISYLELWQPFVQQTGSICAILVDGIKNNSVKIFRIWTSGLGGNTILRYFLSGALTAILFSGATSFEGYMRNNSVNLF